MKYKLVFRGIRGWSISKHKFMKSLRTRCVAGGGLMGFVLHLSGLMFRVEGFTFRGKVLRGLCGGASRLQGGGS